MGKGASGLPAWSREIHLNVLCRRWGSSVGQLAQLTRSSSPTAGSCLQVSHPTAPKALRGVFEASPRTLVISAQPCPSPPASWDVPFCTLSHSRKISSPPRQLPEFRFTRQIFSSAVLGAPEGVGTRKEALNHQTSPGLACRRCNLLVHPRVKVVWNVLTAPPHSHWLLTPTNSSTTYLLAPTMCPALL